MGSRKDEGAAWTVKARQSPVGEGAVSVRFLLTSAPLKAGMGLGAVGGKGGQSGEAREPVEVLEMGMTGTGAEVHRKHGAKVNEDFILESVGATEDAEQGAMG